MGRLILLVDDDEVVRKAVRGALEFKGYDVVEVADGSEALPVIEERSVDLVITDILMPNVEGNELVMRVKQIKPKNLVKYATAPEGKRLHKGCPS